MTTVPFNPLHTHNLPPSLHPPKLQLVTFGGSELLDTLFHAEEFFSLYQVPLKQRLHMAFLYMNGDALRWLKRMITVLSLQLKIFSLNLF